MDPRREMENGEGEEQDICPFCLYERGKGGIPEERIFYEDLGCGFYIVFPEEPAMPGHLLVVLRTPPYLDSHITDITDERLTGRPHLLGRLMRGVHGAARALKEHFNEQGDPVERVYIVSQCDGASHLHFHLKPRRKGEETGDLFLLQKEMEEARWKEGEDKAEERLGRLHCTHQKYASLVDGHRWKRNPKEWRKWLQQTMGVNEKLYKYLGSAEKQK